MRARPEELTKATVPFLVARISSGLFAQLFPVEMDELDPLSEPEPSRGALIQLENRDLVVVTYGTETGTLTISRPVGTSSSRVLKGLLAEVPLDASFISWQEAAQQPGAGREAATALAKGSVPRQRGHGARRAAG